MTDAIASGQIRSYIDRILRLKAEQDDLAADIREIYAEAKSNGFDKTALGQVVTQIRKEEKNPERYAELTELARLYMDSYEARPAPARARVEIIGEFAPEKVSVSALPIVTAAPDLAAEESVGTDPSPLVPEQKATPAADAEPPPRQESGGTHSDDDEGIPTWLQRGHPDCVVREQGRG